MQIYNFIYCLYICEIWSVTGFINPDV